VVRFMVKLTQRFTEAGAGCDYLYVQTKKMGESALSYMEMRMFNTCQIRTSIQGLEITHNLLRGKKT
jgi:hypothetical protein